MIIISVIKSVANYDAKNLNRLLKFEGCIPANRHN